MKYKDTIEAIRESGLLKYHYEFTPNIGLHRTTIKDLHIRSINPDLLLSTNAKYLVDPRCYGVTDDGIPFSSISKIRLEHVNEFKASAYFKPHEDIWTESVILDSSPTSAIKLNSLSDYFEQLNTISSELSKQYGITIDTEKAKFKAVEIAAEFILKAPLSEYSRAFHVLKSVNTNNVAKIDTLKPDDGINCWQSCLYKKSCYELYIYDKTRQLYEQKKIVLSENIIKMELRIPDTYLYQTKIKGSLSDLNDNDLKSYFLTIYNRIIHNPFIKWYKNYPTRLNDLVSQYRTNYKRWITELYKHCVESETKNIIELIDWHDILKCPYIKSLDRRTQDRIKKQLKAVFGETSFSCNTYDQLSEIWMSITNCNKSTMHTSRIVLSNKPL